VKLTALAVFGAGYVLGSRAGRERYDQLRELARTAAEKFETSGARQRMEAYGGRLEAYSSRARSGHRPSD
jgi:hypothetical protein